MGYGISIGILVGIIITIFYDRVLSPIIDLKYEHYRYKISTKCTEEKLDADSLVFEFNRIYPEAKEKILDEDTCGNAIGFHMDNEEKYDDFEEEDDE